jgi:hypothetical protein
MIGKNKMTVADRAFWAHCEAVAREVSLWPGWMRGEAGTPPSPSRRRRTRRTETAIRSEMNYEMSKL